MRPLKAFVRQWLLLLKVVLVLRGGGSLWVGGATLLSARLAIVEMIIVVGKLLPS